MLFILGKRDILPFWPINCGEQLELVFYKYIIAIQYGTLLIFSLQKKKKKIEEEEEERNHKQSFALYWVWHLDHLIQYAKLLRRVILHV